jgi:hypothetical protein
MNRSRGTLARVDRPMAFSLAQLPQPALPFPFRHLPVNAGTAIFIDRHVTLARSAGFAHARVRCLALWTGLGEPDCGVGVLKPRPKLRIGIETDAEFFLFFRPLNIGAEAEAAEARDVDPARRAPGARR